MTRRVLGLLCVVALLGACTRVQVVRLDPARVHVGERLEPIAAIQVTATSAYVLFVPIPGGVDLDRLLARLYETARALGADKVTGVTVDIDSTAGVWGLRLVLGWRSARVKGIAVKVLEPQASAR